ncbi:uncharacterized protein CDAR_490921 [Caerostris darwini]|uniref:Ig-like domain-containing protein n=1 Tax=Caerostris darwini TaxID=1538125 RepID=A0AAV4X6G5_9ARAC|nr:uncharacterized protein CDAR_490921 [Caerostris darwini]
MIEKTLFILEEFANIFISLGDIDTVRSHFIKSRALSTKGWSNWMPWDCSVSCGGGTGVRNRICFDPDLCQGPEFEKGKCNTQPCSRTSDEKRDTLVQDIRKNLLANHNNFQVKEGEKVTLPCKGKMQKAIDQQSPNAKVTWVLNGKTLQPDGTKRILKKNQDLQISKAASKDNGIYTCIITLKKISITVSLSSVAVQNSKSDLEVELGDSFILFCNGVIVGRTFPTKLTQKWYHNTTLYKEYKKSKPQDINELTIKSSKYTDSGIYKCKIDEREGKARGWVTNVIRVKVIPPIPLYIKLLPLAAILLVLLILIITILCLCLRRKKVVIQKAEKAEENEAEEASKKKKRRK